MRRMTRAATVAATGVLAVGLIAGCSGSTKTVAGPTTTATVTATVNATVTARPVVTKVVATKTKVRTETYTPPPPHAYGDGTYVVGQDIKPGRYQTSASGSICYWARLSSLNTNDIIENGNPTGQTTIQVQSGDKALQIQGDCKFSRR